MKTIGEVFSTLFDKQFVEKAQGYSKLFNSWEDITAKNGIASAAVHSRIKDLDRGILQIEMDHPGWKQILQTKQSKLLNDFRYRFPEMDISGISFMLGYNEQAQSEIAAQEKLPAVKSAKTDTAEIVEPSAIGYDAIKDEGLKKKLISIGEKIAARENGLVRELG